VNYSTFWTIKATLGWGFAVTGVWWADEGVAARAWMLLLAASITCSVIAVVFRREERQLAAFQLGLELRDSGRQGVVTTLPRRG